MPPGRPLSDAVSESPTSPLASAPSRRLYP